MEPDEQEVPAGFAYAQPAAAAASAEPQAGEPGDGSPDDEEEG